MSDVLPLVVDNLEEVEESLRPLFGQKGEDGKHHIIGAVKSEIQKSTSKDGQIKHLEAQIQAMAKVIAKKTNQPSVNPDDYSVLEKGAKNKDLGKESDEVKNLRDVLKKAQDTIKEQEESIIKSNLNHSVMSALTKHGLDTVNLPRLVVDDIDVVKKEDGTTEIQIKGDNKETLYGESGLMTVDEYAKSIVSNDKHKYHSFVKKDTVNSAGLDNKSTDPAGSKKVDVSGKLYELTDDEKTKVVESRYGGDWDKFNADLIAQKRKDKFLRK